MRLMPQATAMEISAHACVLEWRTRRMLFLDSQSRFFRGFIGRIRSFGLPIHLQAKSDRRPPACAA
jgi:hypothetical protein